jgi:hypothetical protein
LSGCGFLCGNPNKTLPFVLAGGIIWDVVAGRVRCCAGRAGLLACGEVHGRGLQLLAG